MKNFTTDLSKYYSAIIVAVTMLTYAFSASAEEYKSMIRYDRVWEHIYVHWNDRQVTYVRFDGPDEINGKTYHRLVAFRKASFDYNSDSEPYLFDVDANYYEHEGYLREEDGKVYTLIVKGLTEGGYIDIQLYTPDLSYPDSYAIEEKLLYDFTCKEGERYSGLQIEKWGEEMDYKVMSIEHVEIEGEDHRLLRINPIDEWHNPDDGSGYYYAEPVVEGIGITSYGCLTTINFLWMPTCPCMGHMFNRVLSMDGKVLYRQETGSIEIPVNDFLGVNGIAEITDNPESDAPIHDILGRRITEPVPGQLYIQSGKKHIAK